MTPDRLPRDDDFDGKALGVEELRKLSRWLSRMAERALETLEEIGRHDRSEGGSPTNDGVAAGWAEALLPKLAEYEYRDRRRRTDLFDEKFFGEPAWDMLLDLFINRARGQTVATTSLCIASGVPPTTALRWIGVLEKKGLVRRFFSERDQRLHYVELTEAGFYRVAEHFRERLRQLP